MRKNAIITACAGLLFLAGPALGHDFWLHPAKFTAQKKSPTVIQFLIGHVGAPESWPLSAKRVVDFRSIGPDGVTDQRGTIHPALPQAPGYATPAFNGAGSHILVFESTDSFSELPAEKFNDYAKEAGLTAILDWRARNGRDNEPGREFYSRRAKTIVQVGNTPTDNVSVPVGHMLEIVPEHHPLLLAQGASLPVRVHYRGAPLAGALVEFSALAPEAEMLTANRTSADGRARFEIPRPGDYRLSVIWGEQTDIDGAEFETIFASLTFSTNPAGAVTPATGR